MKFKVSEEIFKKFPNYVVGVVVATNIRDSSYKKIDNLLEKSIQKIKKDFLTEDDIARHPYIYVWRDAFSKAGWNPKETKASIDAILNRIVKSGNFPGINKIVDLANYISLKYLLPVGAHDIDRMVGDIIIRLAKDGDKFTPMGSEKIESVPLGEIVYADSIEVRTRRWVWRQGNKAKIFPDTKKIFFPIDGFTDINLKHVISARDELAKLVEKLFRGETQVFLVKIDNPETNEFNL